MQALQHPPRAHAPFSSLPPSNPQVQEAQPFTRKDGGTTCKRSIILRDTSNKTIDVTLWGAHAEDPGNGLEMVSGLVSW